MDIDAKRALERARQAAKRIGYHVQKRNGCGMRLYDKSGDIIAGENFDLTPKDVIRLCPKPTRSEYMCKTDLLKKRLWTADLIDELLGEPDKLAMNIYCSYRPVQRFMMDLILEAEQTTEFKSGRRRTYLYKD